MLRFARRKSGTMASGWAFDLERDRAVAEEAVRSVWLRNSAQRGRNRKRTPTPRDVSQECRAVLANSRKEKIARCPQPLGCFRVSFPPLRAAPPNRQSTAKATTVPETDARLAIAN